MLYITNKMTCASSEDSDQPGIRPGWSVYTVRMKKPWVLIILIMIPTERTAKTLIRLGRQMPKLIWVFARRTCHFVGFVILRLIFLPFSAYSWRTGQHWHDDSCDDWLFPLFHHQWALKSNQQDGYSQMYKKRFLFRLQGTKLRSNTELSIVI